MNSAELFALESNPHRLGLLFKPGDPGDAMYVVLDEAATRGAIIGEMALIDDAPRSATVRARGLNLFSTPHSTEPILSYPRHEGARDGVRRVDHVRTIQSEQIPLA